MTATATAAKPTAFMPHATRSSEGLPTMTAATKCSGWATTVSTAAHRGTAPERHIATPSNTVPTLLALLLAAVAVVVRYRRADTTARRQRQLLLLSTITVAGVTTSWSFVAGTPTVARATRAELRLSCDDTLEIQVLDNGPANGAWSPGIGLQGMRERTDELSGRFEAGPSASGGRVFASFPLGPHERRPGRCRAQRLFLASKTVANQVSGILTKLQVAGPSQAIVRARDAGLGRL